ncbi:MAG TPA: J domain-containing protein [Xanthobacteraceae bacterium]|jgi:DnaJ-class molecular chaperone|nr:J domain-containing protein [Xanthobacteraceae bacterium]
MRDPYSVLGVPKTASPDEIKKAFRRLAKKLHPDANSKDPKAAAKFAELNAAYEIVGDEKKRKAFDRGEIDAEGKPRFHGFESQPGRGAGFGPDSHFESFTWGPAGPQPGSGGRQGAGGFGRFEDVLSEMFGGFGAGRADPGFGSQFTNEDLGARQRSQDVTAAITINLADAVNGATKRIRLPTGKEVEVKIPSGVTDGQQIRLKGQGLAGPRGRTGDVLITVSVAPHSVFKIDGVNLKLDLPISLYEAVLGAKVRVLTLDGAVEIAIPPGTNGGRIFRLKGKGLPSKTAPGDLFATIRIVLPERPDPDLEELMRRWKQAKPYDPRKGLSGQDSD